MLIPGSNRGGVEVGWGGWGGWVGGGGTRPTEATSMGPSQVTNESAALMGTVTCPVCLSVCLSVCLTVLLAHTDAKQALLLRHASASSHAREELVIGAAAFYRCEWLL